MKPDPRFAPLRALLLIGAMAFAPHAIADPALDRPFVDASDVAPRAQGNVLEVAAATGQFRTFLHAVQAAGYQETLRGEGPFTIFAPTDAAFAQMDQRELHRLMQPQNHEELLALLSYHVVPERVTSESARGRVVSERAADGHRVEVDGRDGLRVNDELVVLPNIHASNGMIQGINRVLSPPVLVASN